MALSKVRTRNEDAVGEEDSGKTYALCLDRQRQQENERRRCGR